VHLASTVLAVPLVRRLLQDGGDHATGTAPLGPEIDQDGRSGLFDLRFEVAVRQRQNIFAHRLSRVPTPARWSALLYHRRRARTNKAAPDRHISRPHRPRDIPAGKDVRCATPLIGSVPSGAW